MTQGTAANPETPSEAPTTAFADMHLQPGDRLQLHCPNHPGEARHIVRLVGFVDNLSLLVTTPLPQRGIADFLENEILVVRAFSRNNAYAFKCSIHRLCRAPFAYMHLSFPDRISRSVVRKSIRVQVGLPATVTTPQDGETCTALVENVSATGALLRHEKALAETDSAIRLAFDVHVHDVSTRLEVEALILSLRTDEQGRVHHGIEFRELPPNERMILRSLIYQQMIDNPRSLI